MPDDFTLDADINIPTGVAATPDQVADMLADPGSPLTVEMVAKLDAKQRPTEAKITARLAEAQAAGKMTKEQAATKTTKTDPVKDAPVKGDPVKGGGK